MRIVANMLMEGHGYEFDMDDGRIFIAELLKCSDILKAKGINPLSEFERIPKIVGENSLHGWGGPPAEDDEDEETCQKP